MFKITFVTTVNEPYFFHLSRLYETLTAHIPDAKLIVYCVNLSEYNKKAPIFEKPNVQKVINDINFDSFEHERAFCSNLRAKSLKYVAQDLEDDNFIVYLDVNVLVLKAFNEFIHNMKANIAVAIDDNHPCYSESQLVKWFWPKGPLGSTQFGVAVGGIQIYKLSKDVRLFLEKFDALVMTKQLSWFADQEALFLLIKRISQDKVENILSKLAIGVRPSNESIVAYRKGGANNVFYDELSTAVYYSIEGINHYADKIEGSAVKYAGVTKLNLVQRFCRKMLLTMKRKIK